MKIQCDVCEKAQATVICCADEAALCAKCDVEVHAANKLASKHQRLLLQCLSNKLPLCDICQFMRLFVLLFGPNHPIFHMLLLQCLFDKLTRYDICQEKTAFIFCVEDRALFCKDCDEPIHAANTRAANHQRFLATGIRVALGNSCSINSFKSHNEPKPPKSYAQQVGSKTTPHQVTGFSSTSWGTDDLLQFPEYESSDKKEHLEFGELEWLSDMSLFGEQSSSEALAPAEVPQLHVPQMNNMISYRSPKHYTPHKKARIEITDDDEEFFTVPDLG